MTIQQVFAFPNDFVHGSARCLDRRGRVKLRYIGGADYETIQMQLGLTNGALRGLLHRGLKLLRARLPRDFESNCGERGASAP